RTEGAINRAPKQRHDHRKDRTADARRDALHHGLGYAADRQNRKPDPEYFPAMAFGQIRAAPHGLDRTEPFDDTSWHGDEEHRRHHETREDQRDESERRQHWRK